MTNSGVRELSLISSRAAFESARSATWNAGIAPTAEIDTASPTLTACSRTRGDSASPSIHRDIQPPSAERTMYGPSCSDSAWLKPPLSASNTVSSSALTFFRRRVL
jgi:hypothetical protein